MIFFFAWHSICIVLMHRVRVCWHDVVRLMPASVVAWCVQRLCASFVPLCAVMYGGDCAGSVVIQIFVFRLLSFVMCSGALLFVIVAQPCAWLSCMDSYVVV